MANRYIKDGVFATKCLYYNGSTIINPTEEQLLEAGYQLYVEPTLTEDEQLEKSKELKIMDIIEYGDNDELNSYVAQGNTIRLPINLRLRLRNVINAKIALGETTLTEWYDGYSYTYPLSVWDTQLTQYENYEYNVLCITEQHKSNVKALTTIEEVEAYDYTTGYPTQLNFA